MFEEPPERRPSSKWSEVREQLRARPGEWARVLESPDRDVAYQARAALTANRTGAAFEARTGRCGDGFACWARYVGEASDE